MIGKPTDTVIQAWARLMRTQQLALGSIQNALKAAGLPPLDWYDVLLEVERAGPDGIRPFELEKATLFAQYNLSRLLSRVERAGYIERRDCDNDGRGQLIVITKTGKAVRRKMWPVYARGIEKAIGAHLSGKEAEELNRLLGIVLEKG